MTSGALRKLDQRFAPSASWADAGDVLARAFVRARFGDAVDTPPEKPHQVRGGKIEPYDAGEPIPQHGDASATGNAGDIRSVPRM